MPLTNFGSVLNFAELIEAETRDIYQALSENGACSEYKSIFLQFSTDAGKNVKTVQRTRRENVTEMILEGIDDFFRDPYRLEIEGVETMNPKEAMDAALRLERRAESYFTDAALKLKAIPEAARSLKMIAKKHAAHIRIQLKEG